jgi:trimeric autotransporter adhesin
MIKFKFFNALTILLILLQAVMPIPALAMAGTDLPDYTPGSVVTISGDNSDGAGFLPGENVHVDVSDPDGAALSCDAAAGEDAAWSCQVTLPSDAAEGEYSYAATGQGSGASQSGSFTVTAPPPPSIEPTQEPTQAPTQEPTSAPTLEPTVEPTQAPTEEPTSVPAAEPTQAPTQQPTAEPTQESSPTAPAVLSPFIRSDKEDYAPAELVTLTSGNWQPGEWVEIYVNDNVGQTWSIRTNRQADASGAFVYQFSLPNWFVATYQVIATGQTTGVATTSFTDASSQISGKVVNDVNGNGIDDAEAGLAGAIITIYKDKTSGSGIVVGTLDPTDNVQAGPFTTTSTGLWDSGTMPVDNTYFVVETDPAGYSSTNALKGTDTSNITTSVVNTNQFKVVVASVGGSTLVTSTNNKFLDRATCTTPSITTQPGSQTVTYGVASVNFSAAASGTPAPSLQWQVSTNGGGSFTNIGGATSSSLTINNPTVAMSGNQYRAVFTNTCTPSTATSTAAILTVNPKSLTVTASASNKVYDGTTAASVTLSDDRVSGDTFTTNFTSAAFANKNVGTGKAVTVSGISISGGASANYTLSSTMATTTADITAKSLTVSGITASNKIYDGNTTATLNTGSAALVGAVSGDSVTLNTGSATGAFSSKTVGTGKTITVSGLAISGTDASNYSLTQPVTTADITAKGLTVSGVTANNKVYDGNTAATVNTGSAALVGVIFGDNVTLNTGSASGLFADKNIGIGKTVTISGLTISGADSGNYSLTQPAAIANISAKPLTGSITADNKSYDGTTTATIASRSLSGVVSGDVVSYVGGTATFDDKNVGTGKTVTATDLSLSGTDAGNYTVNSTATTTANITARILNATAHGVNKVYDGTTAATVTFTDDRQSGDDVTVTYSASFVDKNVGTNKSISVTGMALTGADAGNYSLASTSDSTTADITALHITGAFTAANKVYDGNNSASVLSRLLVGEISGDDVALDGGTATFNDKTAANNKTVTLSGATLAGDDAGNYILDSVATTTGDIGPLHITGAFTVADKIYDGNDSANVLSRSLVGAIDGDDVALAGGTATFNNKNVANGKTVTLSGSALTGDDAGNYILDSVATTAADITALHITGSFTADDKVYDGTTSATVLTLSLNGVLGLNAVSLTGGTATFENKNVDTGKTVTLSGASLTGADAGNYALDSVSTTSANITALHITGNFTAASKVYDGNNSASVLSRSLVGEISGDDVALDGGTATFNNKTVANNKTVTLSGATLAGADAGNYILDSVATTTADITALGLVCSITAANKTYDGNNSATITGHFLSGVLGSDDVSCVGGAATFDDKTAANGKTVSATGLSLSGADAGDYSVNDTATTTADITALHITGSFTADDKVYDSSTFATVLSRSLDGVLGADTVSLTGGTATFGDKNVGTGKTVTLTGATLAGADAGNYALDSVATALADITTLHITGNFAAANKTYDATTSANVLTRTLNGAFGSDAVSLSGGTATFDNKNVGTGKTVTLTGAALTGVDSGNYALDSVATTIADITALHITGNFTADNKTYDGTASATVLTRTLNGVFGVDAVSLTGGTAAFDDKNVDTDKTVTLSGATLTGDDAGNYFLDSVATTTADINPLHITGAFTVDNKVYDGNNSASVLSRSLVGEISGDDISLSGDTATFNDKNVANGKIVTLSGATLAGVDAANYILDSVATTNANITARALTVSATGQNKIYDGTTNATVTLSDDRVSGDTLIITYDSASFDTKNVGTSKSVTVSGISITGADAGNYTFNTTTSTTAEITARALSVTATGIDKVYEATTVATVTLSTDGLSGDDVTASYTSASFADRHVGTSKTVSVSGISIGGMDAGNYSLSNTTATTAADITPRPLTITALTNSKTYDSTTSAAAIPTVSGLQGSDTVTGLIEAYVTKTAGTGKTLFVSAYTVNDGNGGSNYTVNTVNDTTGVITQVSLTASITASDKVYDGSTAAAFNCNLVGVIGTDVVTCSSGSATFDDKNVGTDQTVTATGLSLSGADAGNYTVNATATTTADITARPLHITATGINKTYDGTTDASVTLSDDKVAGDDVSTSYTTAAFSDKNVGMGKAVTVSGISISGEDTGNYMFNIDTTTTANITARALTITAHGINKVYNSTTTAAVTLTDNRVAGDVFTDSYTTASFADKNVGTGKTVSVSGISISGTDAGNYTFNTTASTTAHITPRDLTVTATADNKVYDGSTTAVAHLSDDRVAGDVFTTNYTSTNFSNQNVGTGKPVSVSGISITGTDAGNYNLLNTSASATADITSRPVTVTADAKTKVYGNTDPAFTYQVTSGTVVSGDTFSGALNRVTGENAGTYAINQNTLTLGSNYTITYVGANLTITQAILTVTADNKSKFFGDADPAFTFQYSGFVNGETASVIDTAPTCGVTVAHAAVGTYLITCSGGADNNYSFNYVSGTLTVSAWTMRGFYSPVDMGTSSSLVYNTIKGGQTVPLKFEVFSGSTELTNVSAVQPLSTALVSCTSGPEDAIELTATGNTELRYDSTSGQFIYNWKTPTGTNKCYKVTVTAADGISKLIAYFKLK